MSRVMPRVGRALIPLLILALSVVGFLILRATGPEAPAPEGEERAWPVRGFVAEPGTHHPSVVLYGRSGSAQDATLRAAVRGDVAEVPARDGQTVREGDLLVRIDPAEAQLALRQARAEADELEGALESEQLRARFDREALVRERELRDIASRGLERARDLRERDMGSDSDVDDARERLEQAELTVQNREEAVADAPMRLAAAEARLDRARAAAEQASLDLERTKVRAPFDARVVSVRTSPGERARDGDELVRLFNLDDLEIRAGLPLDLETRLETLLAEDQPLQAVTHAGGRDITTELERIEGETRSGASGSRGVFRVVDGGRSLGLNRFLELDLRLPEEADSLVVPFEALYGRDRVFRVEDGRLQSLTVERLGEYRSEAGDTLALIRQSEIESGDVLVATRLPNAVDGLRVEVEDDEDLPSAAEAVREGEPDITEQGSSDE